MREWKKIKNELKKYNKFESLYIKLKEIELKEYEEKVKQEINRKREIIKGWTLQNKEDNKELRTSKKKRRKPLTKKKIALMK